MSEAMHVKDYIEKAVARIKVIEPEMADIKARCVAAVCLLPILDVAGRTAPEFFEALLQARPDSGEDALSKLQSLGQEFDNG